MKLLLTSLLFALTLSSSRAGEFTAPKAYPMQRYEAGWMKNPFTLKTAPAAVRTESFAKDLVLGGITQIGDSTNVVVINAKTRVRTPLHDKEPDSQGIKVKAVHLEDARKDTYVEIESGNESAILRYDEMLLKQLVARQDQSRNGVPQPHPMFASNNAPVSPSNAPAGLNATSPQPQTVKTMAPNGYAPRPGVPIPAAGGAAPFSNANIPTTARRRMLTAPTPLRSR